LPLADTSTPVFHPTQPLVIWAITEVHILAGNYETGRVHPFVAEFSLGSEAVGDDEDEGSAKDNKSDDGSDESVNRNAEDRCTLTMGKLFPSTLSRKNFLLTLTSPPFHQP